MILNLIRSGGDDKATWGNLYVDGAYECDTLEDPIRQYPDKIKKQTCIWGNRVYELTIDMSPKYGRPMMHVLGVPLFDGIRIHSGNTAEDTEGCILVGDYLGKHVITNSRVACGKLFKKVQRAVGDKERVLLVVTNPHTF